MKILVDAHVFDGKFQGTRTYIKGLYNELIKRNPSWEFYIISNSKKNVVNEFVNSKNVTFEEFRFNNRVVQLLVELPYIAFKKKIDFSHFQYISPFFKIGKYIVTNHDILFQENRFKKYFPWIYRFIKGPLFRFSANQADILFTVSEYSKTKISALYNIPKKRIGVTTNAVEILFEEEEEVPTKDELNSLLKTKYLLIVSRIEPRKNHISVLRAFINLKLSEDFYNLVFIGNYDIKCRELDSYIENHQGVFNKHLFIYHNVSNSELYKLYKNAHLILYPSIAEGFGIPPLEGAIFGKKVLCSNLTAMSDFTFFPYHINPLNQVKLENTIAEVLSDDNYPYEYVKEKILTKYTWEISAKEFETFLNNNMNKK